MTPPPAPPAAGTLWELAGHSVRGTAHARAGLPNQDALALWPTAPGGHAMAVAAVADGHGGARHFRSATGARLAVEAMREELHALGEQLAADPGATHAPPLGSGLTRRIVARWTQAVHRHLEAEPVMPHEWEGVTAAEGEAAFASVRADPMLAYGATVLGALALPQCTLLLQLGDGDVLAVDAQGRTTRPVPPDTRLAGNFTTSICRSGAAADFRFAMLPAGDDAPALLLLSTDGYANSFRTDADFLQLGRDFLALSAARGVDGVGAALEAILEDASRRGSGDDITLALLRSNVPAATALPASAGTDEGAPDRRAALGAEAAMRRWRLAACTLGLALCASLGWQWRDALGLRTAPAAAAAGAPTHRPAEAAAPASATAPGEHAAPAWRSGAAPQPGDAATALRIEAGQVHARRLAGGVEITLQRDPALPVRAGCLLQARVWGPAGALLARGQLPLAETAREPLASDAPWALLLPYPDGKAGARGMQRSAATFSVELACGTLTVAESERLPIAG